MLETLTFVSYRRSDAAPFALALKSELEKRLANTLVFVDMLRINPGETWPDVLSDALERAQAVLVLIGPRWLEREDGVAVSRVFEKDDWVRKEIEIALGKDGIAVLPVLIGNATLPTKDKLPDEISHLLDKQVVRLSPDNWHSDLSKLSSVLASNIGVDQSRIELPWPRPHPIKKRVPLTTKQIIQELRSEGILQNWRVELEHDYAGDGTFAEQLVLRVRFRSFVDAIRFMGEFASECDRQHHHPIWENVHRNLTIKLRTFDAGHRVSHFDLQMAEKINRALQAYDVQVM